MKQTMSVSLCQDYYSSLLKAYLVIKSRDKIIQFLETHAASIPLDYDHLLFNARLYHGAAIVYSAHEKHEQTLDIWRK